jgi:hypothetical protein
MNISKVGIMLCFCFCIPSKIAISKLVPFTFLAVNMDKVRGINIFKGINVKQLLKRNSFGKKTPKVVPIYANKTPQEVNMELFIACQQGDTEKVKELLISNRADPNFKHPTTGISVISHTAYSALSDEIKYTIIFCLMRAGADLNNFTCISLDQSNVHEFDSFIGKLTARCIREQDYQLMQKVIQQGAQVRLRIEQELSEPQAIPAAEAYNVHTLFPDPYSL